MTQSVADSKPGFWFFGENQLAHGRDPGLRHDFRALMFHGLLYEPCLVVSDSYLLNNLNLRRALREDAQVREAVRRSLLRVACRKENGSRLSLPDNRDRTLRRYLEEAWAGSDLRYFPRDEYQQTEELRFVEEHATFIEFSLDEVSAYYTSNIRQAMRTDAAAVDVLGPDVAGVVAELVEEEVKQNKGKLLRAFFYQDAFRDRIDDQLRSLGGWKKLGDVIREIADSFYFTGLPDLIETCPLYPEAIARAIEFARRRRRDIIRRQGGQSQRLVTRLSPGDFFKALELLGVDEISALHERDEWRNYRDALTDLEQQSAVVAAFHDYRRVIDDTVVRCLGSPNTNLNYVQLGGEVIFVDSEGGGVQQAFLHFLIDEGLTGALEGSQSTTALGVANLVRNLFQSREPEQEAVRHFARDKAVQFLQKEGGGRVKSTTHVEVDSHATVTGVHGK